MPRKDAGWWLMTIGGAAVGVLTQIVSADVFSPTVDTVLQHIMTVIVLIGGYKGTFGKVS